VRNRLIERLADVRAAISTMPDAQTWLRCLLIYAVFLACALPLGFASGFFRVEVATLSRSMLILLPCLCYCVQRSSRNFYPRLALATRPEPRQSVAASCGWGVCARDLCCVPSRSRLAYAT
jgi:hypothetical protein